MPKTKLITNFCYGLSQGTWGREQPAEHLNICVPPHSCCVALRIPHEGPRTLKEIEWRSSSWSGQVGGDRQEDTPLISPVNLSLPSLLLWTFLSLPPPGLGIAPPPLCPLPPLLGSTVLGAQPGHSLPLWPLPAPDSLSASTHPGPALHPTTLSSFLASSSRSLLLWFLCPHWLLAVLRPLTCATIFVLLLFQLSFLTPLSVPVNFPLFFYLSLAVCGSLFSSFPFIPFCFW